MNILTYPGMIMWMLFACFSCKDASTKLTSYTLSDRTERIKRVQTEITLRTQIIDTEFDLFNVNGFSQQRTLVPGASSIHYKFALKVLPDSIEAWVKEMHKVDSVKADLSWVHGLVASRKENWIIHSRPEFYIQGNSNNLLVVHKEEGILFRKIVIE